MESFWQLELMMEEFICINGIKENYPSLKKEKKLNIIAISNILTLVEMVIGSIRLVVLINFSFGMLALAHKSHLEPLCQEMKSGILGM